VALRLISWPGSALAIHPEILDRPPAEGARSIALAMVAEARERADRLADPADAEALHDFRVSVRRLRSTLRAWRGPLGKAVRDKDLDRLRRVARATGEARNAEVLRAWIAETARSLPRAHRPAAGWLLDRLAPGAKDADLCRSVDRLRAAADALADRLMREKASRSPRTFAAALAARIRVQAGSVSRCLGRVEPVVDLSLAHRARIEGKRLRYLLEPLREVPGADPRTAERALKRLQDLLGDLNDAHLARSALRKARREAGDEEARAGGRARRSSLVAGLLVLEHRARRREAALLARLRREVLPTQGAAMLEPALRLAASLHARGSSRS